MARYTVELGTLMENEQSAAVINKALSSYPIYAPEKPHPLIPTREELNKRFINRFYYKEIGFETFGRFAHELEIAMTDRMPLVNEVLKTIEIMANIKDPFGNVDMEETFRQTSENDDTTQGTSSLTQAGSSTATQNGTSNVTNTGSSSVTAQTTEEGTSSTTSNSKHVKSDTPQNSLTIGAEGIDTVKHASEAEWNKDINSGESGSNTTAETGTETSDTSTGETSNIEENNSQSEQSGTSNVISNSKRIMEYVHKKIGNQGVTTYARDMNEFRTSIIDVIDQYLFRHSSITDLFMFLL